MPRRSWYSSLPNCCFNFSQITYLCCSWHNMLASTVFWNVFCSIVIKDLENFWKYLFFSQVIQVLYRSWIVLSDLWEYKLYCLSHYPNVCVPSEVGHWALSEVRVFLKIPLQCPKLGKIGWSWTGTFFVQFSKLLVLLHLMNFELIIKSFFLFCKSCY